MLLRSLQTLNFRNLEPKKLEFGRGITAVVGGNGMGKSNVLEAAFLALTGLIDVSKLETVVLLGERQAFVGAEVEREDGITKLEVGLAPGKKLAKVDGVKVRIAELARHASAVLIRPEDADLVHGSPSVRREFIDRLVARVSPRYGQLLAQYERVVQQRNALLKLEKLEDWMLEVWDEKMLEYGTEIMRLRRRATGRLAELAHLAHQDLAGNNKSLELSLLETARLDDMPAHLREKRREEMARGSTAIGPHRDDLELRLMGNKAADFASRGEARTIALALRQAEYVLLGEKFKEAPVLFIDDFSAELDSSRREYLLMLAQKAPQAIVTGTESPPMADCTWRIENGRLDAYATS
ncbi:MAG: DNA replication/repair protein RecF [Deinococcales bacterium]